MRRCVPSRWLRHPCLQTVFDAAEAFAEALVGGGAAERALTRPARLSLCEGSLHLRLQQLRCPRRQQQRHSVLTHRIACCHWAATLPAQGAFSCALLACLRPWLRLACLDPSHPRAPLLRPRACLHRCHLQEHLRLASFPSCPHARTSSGCSNMLAPARVSSRRLTTRVNQATPLPASGQGAH